MKRFLLLFLLPISAFAQINDLLSKPAATSPAVGDYLYLQGATNKTRKLAAQYYEPALGVPGVNDYVLSSKTDGTRSWVPMTGGGGGGGTWGSITGTLSAQSDLNTALGLKLAAASNLSDLANAVTARTNLGLGSLATQNGTFSGASSGTNTGDQDLSGLVPKTYTVNGHALSGNVSVTTTDLSLNNVTNDAQTKAAIVPNTAPTAGQILVGNAGGTAYAAVSASGDVTIASTGAHTIASNAVTNAKAAQMAANTIKGNNTGSTANAADLTVSQVNTLLGTLTNPMTTTGDIIVGGASGTPTRVAQGSNGTFWGVSGGTAGYYTPAGGGNVSNSGTPTANQIAQWTSSTVIQGVAATSLADSILNTPSTGLVKRTGANTYVAATAGTDYLTPSGSAASLTSFPTLNQNTTGSAATLTTTRTIGGSNFNGSANVTSFPVPGVIGGTTPDVVNGTIFRTGWTAQTAGGTVAPAVGTKNRFATFTSDTAITLPTAVAGDYFVLEAFAANGTSKFTASGSVYRAGDPNSGVTNITPTPAGNHLLRFEYDGTNWIYSDTSFANSVANGATGVTTLSGIVKGNGTSPFSAAAAGTDYVAPSAYASANGLTMATARLLGRTTASTGAAEEITVGSGLSLSAGTLTATGGGTGTVTNTGGNLTANSIMLGAGTVDSKVAAGIVTDGTSKITLGVSGTNVGALVLNNATSGSITIQPTTGALGSVSITAPAVSGTLDLLEANQTSTGINTFSPTARSSGVASYFIVNTPADTGQTAATESVGVDFGTATRTWATTGTVGNQREVFFRGKTYASASASQTFTDISTVAITPPIAGTNAIFTRGHSLQIVDSTSAASSITGGLVVATTLGTTATSVGIGGGNINAGGTLTVGGTQTFTGAATHNNAVTINGAAATTALTITNTARTSGVLPYIKYTIPTDTGQTAATESPGIKGVTGTRTWATTGTVALQREIFFPGPTYASASASQTFTDVFNMYLTPPVAGTNAIFTRGHTLGIVDSTSAASSITGGLVVATTLGTTATSVGIGGGNINAGGTITGGGALSIGTTNSATVGTIELGAATDTTIARVAAGQISVEGVNVSTISSTDTLTNKRVTARVTTITSSATPTVNTDNCDCVTITALAAAITSMTTNLTGTPSNFDQLEFRIKDDGTARAITWGASFVAGPTALPTTTTISKALHVWFEYDSVQAKWVCLSSGSDA